MATLAPEIAPLHEKIVGTWRRFSWKRLSIPGGEEADALGPDPFCYINYAPYGRGMFFVLQAGRPRPTANPPTDAEKLALYDSLFAYVGTYTVEADRVIHAIDGSWNELWTGLEWVLPSPHIPHSTTPMYYVMTGLLGELGTANQGVGYTLP